MQTEIIVIGSGVAATALITKILESRPDTTITVLEAGGKIKMRDFALYQNYLISNKLPFDHQNIYDSCYDLAYQDRDKPGENAFSGDTEIPMNGSRAFLYGGSTAHWGGWAFRLKEEDFKLRSNLKAKGKATGDVIDWPISYADLEPFYQEAEDFIGVSGDSEDQTTARLGKYPFPAFPFTLEDGLFIDAFNKLPQPISYAHLPIARYGDTHSNNSHGPCHTTGLCKYCPFGARFVAANNLDDLVSSAKYPNLKIITNAIVEEILMDTKDHATGVRYFDKKKNIWVNIQGKRIIAAAGAIETPKLLLRSAKNLWENGIGNDRDLVGRFLISHPYFFYKAVLPKNPQMLQPEMGFPTLVSRHFDSLEEQHKGKFIMINPPSSPKLNLARSMGSGKSREEIIKSIQNNATLQLQGIVEVFSEARNRVTNTKKTNRFGLWETKIEFWKSPGFEDRMKEIEGTVKKIFEQMGAVDVGIETAISWRADHAACTTRMSSDPEVGVVDQNLKIHGTSNIYVCSNSSFSSLGAVNPTLTLTALSLRLAGHLLTELKTEANL